MKEVTKCPCCGLTSIKPKKIVKFNYPGEDIQNNLQSISYVRRWILFEKILKTRQPVVFKIMICNHCGFLFLNPRLTEEEIKIKYKTTNELGDVKVRYSLIPPYNLDKRALRINKLVKQHFHGKLQNKKILDYRGSWGYNLYPFTGGNECYVLDYEKWEHYREGIKYIGNDFTDLKNDDFFDVILILHTLEHAVEPYLFLKEAINYLSPDGLIYIEVPLGVFREYSYLSDPITHLNFFSEESLVKLFSLLGLKIGHISTKNQWIMTSKGLCVNIIGIKKTEDNNKKFYFKTTQYQMHNCIYYLSLAFNKFYTIVSKIVKNYKF